MRVLLCLLLVTVLGASPALAQTHARSHYSRAHTRKIVHNRQYAKHGHGKSAPAPAPKHPAPKHHGPKHPKH